MRVIRKVQRVPRSHGKLFGLVPYDPTVPSLQWAHTTFRNPSGGPFFVPSPFGIGWTVNARKRR
jgi:hypothetical protein